MIAAIDLGRSMLGRVTTKESRRLPPIAVSEPALTGPPSPLYFARSSCQSRASTGSRNDCSSNTRRYPRRKKCSPPARRASRRP